MQNEQLEHEIKRDVIKERSVLSSQSDLSGISKSVDVSVKDAEKIVSVIKAYGNMDLGFGYN